MFTYHILLWEKNKPIVLSMILKTRELHYMHQLKHSCLDWGCTTTKGFLSTLECFFPSFYWYCSWASIELNLLICLHYKWILNELTYIWYRIIWDCNEQWALKKIFHIYQIHLFRIQEMWLCCFVQFPW